MKFCVINNLFPPYERGGAEKIVSLIVKGLQQAGHEVIIITGQPDHSLNMEHGPKTEIFRLDTGNIYPLLEDFKQGKFRKLLWHFIDLFNFSLSYKIRKIVKKAKVDCILTHNLKGLGLRVFSGLKKIKACRVHTLHDFQLLDPQGTMFRNCSPLNLGGFFYRLYRFFTRRLTSKIDAVIAPSNFILQKHFKFGFFKHSKTMVMPNPLEVEEEIKPKQKSGNFKILYLGQLEPHKGVKFLINSFIAWPCALASLEIAGEGSELPVLKNISQCDRRIVFLGKINHGEIKKIFSFADLLAVPSLWWENSPTVIYEAYNYATPVLVSDSGGSAELVKEGKTGYVFSSGNQDELIGKFQQIYENRAELNNLGANARNFAKNLRVENYLAKLTDLCGSLMK